MGDQMLLCSRNSSQESLVTEFYETSASGYLPSVLNEHSDELEDPSLHATITISDDNNILEPIELPSFSRTFCHIHFDPKRKPKAKLIKAPSRMRFRYESEIRHRPLIHCLDTSNIFRLKVSKFIGKIRIKVDLVRNKEGDPHCNQIHFPSNHSKWKLVNNTLILETEQIQQETIYDLVNVVIIRLTHKIADQHSIPPDKRPGRHPLDVDRPWTSNVIFRFRITFEETETITIYSDSVTDSKVLDSCPRITFICPNSASFGDETEVTILGENFSSKCGVYFQDETTKGFFEARILLRHRHVALVIKTPQVHCQPENKVIQLLVVSANGNKSDPVKFIYHCKNICRKELMDEETDNRLLVKNQIKSFISLKRPHSSFENKPVPARAHGMEKENVKKMPEVTLRVKEMPIARKESNYQAMAWHEIDFEHNPLVQKQRNVLQMLENRPLQSIPIDRRKTATDLEYHIQLVDAIIDGDLEKVHSQIPASHSWSKGIELLFGRNFMKRIVSHLLLIAYTTTDSLLGNFVKRVMAIVSISSLMDKINKLLYKLWNNDHIDCETIRKEEGCLGNLVLRILKRHNYQPSLTDLKSNVRRSIFLTDSQLPKNIDEEELLFSLILIHPEAKKWSLEYVEPAAQSTDKWIGQISVAIMPTISDIDEESDDELKTWADLRKELIGILVREDYQSLAVEIFPTDTKLHRSIHRTIDPATLFLNAITAEVSNQFACSLHERGMTYFAKKLVNCKF